MANLNNGYLSCDLCKDSYCLSDPEIYSFPDDMADICKKCFLHVLENTTWGSKKVKKIIFDYVKVSIPHKLKWQVWERDDFTCKECGAKDNLSVDHIHPESFGGTLEMENLQTLCRSCNSSKKDKIL